MTLDGNRSGVFVRRRPDGVPDRKVTVYHDAGAAIEVICSRCRADDSEIERLAVHFEVARDRRAGVAGTQEAPTRADALSAAWGGAA